MSLRLACARLLLLVGGLALSGCGAERRPNLVLVTLDTTRPDHLGPYGYAGASTPNLDAFAERAELYERAYSTSSWTLPSHASLLTGLLPRQHGAQTAAGRPDAVLSYGVRPLAEEFTTLAERLAAAGYRTGAVVGGPALRRELGLAQGFELYDDSLSGLEEYTGKRAQRVASRAIAWLREVGDEPYFLFVNFFDPHAPYRPPAPFDRGLPEIEDSGLGPALLAQLEAGAAPRRPGELEPPSREALAAMRAGYDAEIAYMDRHLGRLLDAILSGPAGDSSWIAITSDHGESFGEHYFVSHGAHLYEDNVWVPLLIRRPGDARAGRRIEEPVQNLALFALLLNAARAPGSGDGALRLQTPDLGILTEVRRSDLNVRLLGPILDRDLRALLVPPHKLIQSSDGAVELYDLEADPEELSGLATRAPERVAQLREQLEAVEAAHPALFDPGERARLSDETRDALRALGYLE